MNVFIYDTFVSGKKHDSIAARIETRITDLGLNGKIVRIGLMNSVEEIIENEVRKESKAIIVVGNNNIFNQAISAIARLKAAKILLKGMPLGFIPIGKKDNDISDYLGIDLEEDACNILAARRVTELNLGMANDDYFLKQAIITAPGTKLEIDKDYTIEIMESGEIEIKNIPFTEPEKEKNRLELQIKTKKFRGLKNRENQSTFNFTKLRIFNQNNPVVIDNSIEIQTPVNVQTADEKIEVIVGKNRKF